MPTARRHILQNEDQVVARILQAKGIRLGQQSQAADEQPQQLSEEVPAEQPQTEEQQDAESEDWLALPEAAASGRSWRSKVAEKFGFRRRVGKAALNEPATPLLAQVQKPKSPDGGPRHAKPGRIPQKAEKSESQPSRRLRLGSIIAGTAIAAASVIGAGVYTLSSSPSPSPVAHSVAASGNHTEHAPAAPSATPKHRVAIIAGPAKVLPRGNPAAPPPATHPTAPTHADPAVNFKTVPWGSAVSMLGNKNSAKAERMVELEIRHWNAKDPEKAVFMGPTADGTAKQLLTINGHRPFSQTDQTAFNTAMYQNESALLAQM